MSTKDGLKEQVPVSMVNNCYAKNNTTESMICIFAVGNFLPVTFGKPFNSITVP
jgi:hypothetical protein